MTEAITAMSTVQEAKAWVVDNATEGVECPVCTQHVKIYRRKLNSGQAVSLIQMYRLGGEHRHIHLPTELSQRSREEGKLAHWGLIEEMKIPRADGGRAGWWKLTSKGVGFVLGRVSVPRFLMLFDAMPLEVCGEPITIVEALGDRFNYNELMGN